MDVILSFVGLALLVFVAFIIARFLLRLSARVIGCVLTAIIALGIIVIVLIFIF